MMTCEESNVSRPRQKICSHCGALRYEGAVVKKWSDQVDICRACIDAAKLKSKQLHPPQLTNGIRRLLDKADADATMIATWVRHIWHLLDGMGGAARAIVEAANHVPEQHLKLGRYKTLVAQNKAILAMHMAQCLSALDERALRERELETHMKRSIKELSKEELKAIVTPIAAALVKNNPQIAVVALEQAGFDVILKPKKSSKLGKTRKQRHEPK